MTTPLTPSLMWDALASLGRHVHAQAERAWLGRLALEPSLDLTERHDDASLLSVALRGWWPDTGRREAIIPEGAWCLPSEPWRVPVRDQAPALGIEAVAAALIWRGLDPFEHLDQEVLTLDARASKTATAPLRCPLLLAVQAGLDGVVDQMLRLPQAPGPQQMEAWRTQEGEPWLHACLHRRPAIAQVLLQHGYAPDLPNARGITPLMAATDVESVRLLVAHGATVDTEAVRHHWREQHRDQRRAMELVLPEAPDRPSVFDQAFEGYKGGLKADMPGLVVPGFTDPVPVRGVVLLGLILGQPTRKGAVRFDALQAVSRPESGPWTAAERAWASLALALCASRTDKPSAYEDAARIKRRERWTAELKALATVAGVSAAEGWQTASTLLPQIAAFAQQSAITPITVARDDLLARVMEKVPLAHALPILEAWPDRYPLDAYMELVNRPQWSRHLGELAQTAPWSVIFRHMGIMLRDHMMPPANEVPELHRRWQALSPEQWAQSTPERDALAAQIAALPRHDPLVAHILSLDRSNQLQARPATPARPRRRV